MQSRRTEKFTKLYHPTKDRMQVIKEDIPAVAAGNDLDLC
jgi:hypothetical protein